MILFNTVISHHCTVLSGINLVSPPSVKMNLQLGKHSLGTADSDLASGLFLRIDNLAIVNDKGISASALARGPANGLGELGLDIGEEQLFPDISPHPQ